MRGIIQVKEWFWDKLNDQCKDTHCMIEAEYEDVEIGNGETIRQCDHKTLNVAEVINETEKAVYINLDCWTYNFDCTSRKVWIPKSVITAKDLA